MKRILSKRSGFTLIEIVIAFAIFAIMSSMLVSLVQLTLAQRSSNLEFQDRIENDVEYLAFHYVGDADAYDTKEAADDTFRLDFGDKTNVDVTLDYQKRGTDATDYTIDQGLNYFVSDTKNTGSDLTNNNNDSDSNANGPGQAARYDTRLTGSKNLKYIIIEKCEKVAGTEATYIIHISASGELLDRKWDADAKKWVTISGSVPGEDIPYLQYRLIFRGSTGTTEKRKEGDKEYMYTVYPDANIVDFGYVTTTGQMVGSTEYIPASDKPHNKYLVMQTSNNILRFSAPFYYEEWKDGKLVGKGGYPLVGGETAKIWVTFDSDPGLTAASFGDNGKAYGTDGCQYENYPVLLEDNTPDGDKKNPNIYGAYPYQKVEITS